MYVTWVHGFPSGEEKGSFVTVDLGGTNLRVCWVTLNGKPKEGAKKHNITISQNSFAMPEDVKTGEASRLWSFIAESLKDFMEQQNLIVAKDRPLPLGFTFSYPAIQDRIDHATLQTWTKGFDIKGVEGQDVASQLREAMEELDLAVELIAVINDTTGAMIASAYNDPETIIGAIFGTGCNAAYMDKISNIAKVTNTDQMGHLDAETPMAINCEYGAFDNAHRVLPVTTFDKKIDQESPKPGEQAFEKMSAGLYLGEIYRHIILDLHHRGLFLKDQIISKLQKPYCMDTGFLSRIENDTSPYLSNSAKNFKFDFNLDISEEELIFSQLLAHLIAIRGARLCACGIAAICRHQNIKKGHVAADGSVANKHPTFKKRWGQALGEILDWTEDDMGQGEDGQEGPIKLTSAEDGSGVGAAVIVAMEMERRKGTSKTGLNGQ